ncbi:hypothetical protein Trydic_g16771 [Trypoxylus dichotomus]
MLSGTHDARRSKKVFVLKDPTEGSHSCAGHVLWRLCGIVPVSASSPAVRERSRDISRVSLIHEATQLPSCGINLSYWKGYVFTCILYLETTWSNIEYQTLSYNYGLG